MCVVTDRTYNSKVLGIPQTLPKPPGYVCTGGYRPATVHGGTALKVPRNDWIGVLAMGHREQHHFPQIRIWKYQADLDRSFLETCTEGISRNK